MSPNDYTPATETDYLFAEDMAPAVRKSAVLSDGDCDEDPCCVRCHRAYHVEAPGWRWSA